MSTFASPTIVLKFGSSVLTHEQEVWSVVSEIRPELDRARRVVAVVSALWGVTDRLIAQARRTVRQPGGAAFARLIAGGEHQSAALLSLALGQSGIEHTLLTARDIRLVALGPAEDAEPVSVHAPALRRALDRAPVAIVPGFEAIDEQDQPVLLGRGGSDLTAVFLAEALDAEVRLVKDVDGVYEGDPRRSAAGSVPPRRYRTISWSLVRQVAPRLVQPRAAEYAQRHRLDIRVATLGSDGGTLVTDRTEFEAVAEPTVAAGTETAALAVRD